MLVSSLWVLSGAAVVCFAIFDFYTTTMTLNGGGPLAKRFSHAIWAAALGVERRLGGGRLLTAAGPVILLMMILMWFGLCWFGWFLIFCGSLESVVDTITHEPASVLERLYYAGYTITTIGYGDFKASTSFSQLVSIVAGFNGLFLVTLAITYSIPALSAAADRRQLSLMINALGSSTEQIIDRGCGDGSFSVLSSQLEQFSNKISSVSQKHLAYPIVHYFHDPDPSNALPLNLARLHEAITIVLFAFPLPAATRVQLETTQTVIDRFMENLKNVLPVHKSAKSEPPKPPNCSRINALSDAGKTAKEVGEFLEQNSQRKHLLGYIQNDGWQWHHVHRLS